MPWEAILSHASLAYFRGKHTGRAQARWENVDLATPHLQDWLVSQDMEEFTLSQD